MAKQVSITTIKGFTKDVEKVKIITFKEIDIEVKQYLPIDAKIDLIDRIIAGSYEEIEEAKIFNSVQYDILFTYLIAKYYTNLNLSDDKVFEMYDVLKSTGLIDDILEAIPDDEFNYIKEHLESRINEVEKGIERRTNIGYALDKFLTNFNGDLTNAVSVVEKFNPEEVDQVKKMIEIAK
jgi:hypothetical protein